MDLAPILHVILEDYALPWSGFHGVSHWARVLENGLHLAQETGANVDVVSLFAIFHDSRRVDDFTDLGHGQRGADFAAELRGHLFDLGDEEFAWLYRACAGHTEERFHPNMTIQTCWDADRLDLGRVGVLPDVAFLGTEIARRKETIFWADQRASFEEIPDFVAKEWGVRLKGRS